MLKHSFIYISNFAHSVLFYETILKSLQISAGRKKKDKGGMMMMAAAAMGGMMLQMAMGKIALIAGKALLIGKVLFYADMRKCYSFINT